MSNDDNSKDINNNSSSSNISNNDTSIGHTDNINDSGGSIDNSSGGFKVYPAVLNFVAGTFGGIGGVLAGHPFDTIKVRLQSQSQGSMKYSGTINCFTTIIKEEGAAGLFKGITSPMIGVALVNSLLFGVYGSIISWQMGEDQEEPTIKQITVAGSISGFINSAISCPTELAKIQLQMQLDGKSASSSNIRFKGTFDCLGHIYRTHGIRGCYLGMVSTVARETPSYGAYFATYEYCCRVLTTPGERVQDLDGPRLMLAGGLGGIASWLVTYPFDVVKTVIQGQSIEKEIKFFSIREIFLRHYKTEGYGFFFKGLNATILRAFPTNAMTFFAYSTVMRYLEPWSSA